jgi:phenylacetate-CoA ligase
MLREILEYRNLRKRRFRREDEIQDRQAKLLHEILAHAYQKVPFYREKWRKEGILPDQIRNIDDIQELPLITKSETRTAPLSERLSEDFSSDQLEHVYTSGSTGIPMQIAFSPQEGARRRACLLHTLIELGLSPFDRRVTIKRAAKRFNQNPILERLVQLRWRMCLLENAIETCHRFRPQVIVGMPAMLHLFTLQVRKQGVNRIHPRLIITSGEMLLPDTRKLLQETFQVPIRPYYGCWEFGVVAYWCEEAAGYHLATDNLILECLDQERRVKQGEFGQITLTGLTSKAMPFIRYATGDIAQVDYEKCPCGRPAPTIRNIQGRQDDFLVHPDGRLIPPLISVEPIAGLFFLHQYRIIQESIKQYRVEYCSFPDSSGLISCKRSI